MAKKRKTRRQKIIAATRRNVLENTIEEIFPPISIKPTVVNTHVSQPKTYTYVFRDAQKTLLVITTIAVLNVVLFLILKFKIINLFGLVF